MTKKKYKVTGTVKYSAVFDFKNEREAKEFLEEFLEDKEAHLEIGPFVMDPEEVGEKKAEDLRKE